MIMMLSRVTAEFKWVLLALICSFVLVSIFNNDIFWNETGIDLSQTVLDSNLVFEILMVFVFSTFVVFGIKGFFEMYSQKSANVIIFISGVILAAVIFVLSYQILFQN